MQGMSTVERIWPVLLAVFATVSATGNAQSLRIRLLDGRSGKPISNGGANVWVGENRKAGMPIPGDRNGIATLLLTDNAEQVNVDAGANAPPTFLYAPEIRIQVGYVRCHAAQTKFSWLQITPYPSQEWTRTGIVTANTCGKAVAKPEPGELTLFVRPLNFRERMSQ